MFELVHMSEQYWPPAQPAPWSPSEGAEILSFPRAPRDTGSTWHAVRELAQAYTSQARDGNWKQGREREALGSFCDCIWIITELGVWRKLRKSGWILSLHGGHRLYLVELEYKPRLSDPRALWLQAPRLPLGVQRVEQQCGWFHQNHCPTQITAFRSLKENDFLFIADVISWFPCPLNLVSLLGII